MRSPRHIILYALFRRFHADIALPLLPPAVQRGCVILIRFVAFSLKMPRRKKRKIYTSPLQSLLGFFIFIHMREDKEERAFSMIESFLPLRYGYFRLFLRRRQRLFMRKMILYTRYKDMICYCFSPLLRGFWCFLSYYIVERKIFLSDITPRADKDDMRRVIYAFLSLYYVTPPPRRHDTCRHYYARFLILWWYTLHAILLLCFHTLFLYHRLFRPMRHADERLIARVILLRRYYLLLYIFIIIYERHRDILLLLLCHVITYINHIFSFTHYIFPKEIYDIRFTTYDIWHIIYCPF